MAIRVVLFEEQRLVLAAVRHLLEAIPGLAIEGEAGTGEQLLSLVHSRAPDLVVMEVAMADMDAVDVIARIRAQVPECRIVILSAHAGQRRVQAALAAGATGYVLKDSAPAQLRLAIEAVAAGHVYLSPLACVSVSPRRAQRREEALSPRQRQVLGMIADGHAAKRIASMLGVSVKTIENHRAAMMQRLGIPHVARLVVFAVRQKLSRSGAA